MNHLVIPDTQIRPGVPTDHIKALGNYIVRKRPDKVIILGDWWDFPSISSYLTNKEREGQRLQDDIKAGNHAMDLLFEPLRKYNRFKRSRKFLPECHYIPGNHEDRLKRVVDKQPELDGIIGPHLLNADKHCIMHPYLEPINIDGIHYAHYFYNPRTGKPWGGAVKTKLNNIKFSFVQGHSQVFENYREHLNNGEVMLGIVAGAFYMHDENYLGPQGHHWRGCLMLHDVRDGDAAICEIQLKFLLEKYL